MGGSKNTSTSTSGSAQAWAQPFASSAAGNVQSVYGQNQPQAQQTSYGIASLLPGLEASSQGWQGLTGDAQSYYGDVLSGNYLDPSSNPALQGVLDRTARDVTDRTNSQFSMAGRYGSGAHTGALATGLADSENAVLYDAYNRERGIQDAAAGQVGQQGASTLAQLLQAAGTATELPYVGTNALAGGLSSLFGGGTSTATQSQSGLGNILGGVGSLASGVAGLRF